MIRKWQKDITKSTKKVCKQNHKIKIENYLNEEKDTENNMEETDKEICQEKINKN